HNVKEALLYKNPQTQVSSLNGLGYFYPLSERVVNSLYMTTIKHFPFLWGKAYDRKKVVASLAPLRKFVNVLTFRKLESLIERNKPDCFVATQAFPCGLVADFKKRFGLATPLIGVATDYHPHRFWVHPCVDRYVVACSKAKEVLVRVGVEESKIQILGIPISVKFLTTYPRDQISEELGFVRDLNSVLLMGGGLGIGPIKQISQRLDKLKCDFQIIVICGKNKNLYQWFLREKKNFKKPLFVFEHIDFVYKIMDFVDIIITKGGGITISEALAKGLSIIVTSPIPGQEEKNVEYLLEKEAILRADTTFEIEEMVEKLLNDQKFMYSMKEKAKSISFIDSSLRIVDLVLELTS
ncbi:MAG: hypothetical protein GF375_01285, partial [Candidatus Omnitrophica bacterium]|nr:hypothetical protein [Candidatus Omnitrophota bacterium]MBD3268763.1 hypothetical protein [Candidatus Omnitrophota bacterium]